jgi:glycosyltransferase involved in cell wall biosynthesis
VSISALAPFGRGTNTPLAGRKILQIVPSLVPGGDERSTLAVAAALVEAGARALVACDPGQLASELQAVGGLHVPFPSSTKNPLAMAFNVRRLAKIINSERIDLVHARSRTGAWVALGACRRTKRALVTTIHTDGGGSAPRTSFESAFAEGDFVIAPSQFIAERTRDIFPAALTRLKIVRPGLDLSEHAPESVGRQRVAQVRESWGVALHERVVLAPARLAPDQGQRLIIEAAALLKSRGVQGVRFVLAGDAAKPAFAHQLDTFAAARGVKSMVARVGAPTDRPAAFVAAAAVVFPVGAAEGITRTTVEAAATGALMIVSDVGPAREIVSAPPHAPAQERSGWLVPPNDAASLADAIEAAITLGASAREAIRQRLRRRIAMFYSIERMTHDTLNVYAEALEMTRP